MAAGVDTTALTLVWFCYALANGILELSPGEAFTESKLEEVHRLASVVPMAIPHCARFDSYVGRYIIPKGSIVIFNLYSVHQAQLREIARGNSTGGCPFAHEQTSKQKLYFCESALPFSVGEYSLVIATTLFTETYLRFDLIFFNLIRLSRLSRIHACNPHTHACCKSSYCSVQGRQWWIWQECSGASAQWNYQTAAWWQLPVHRIELIHFFLSAN